MAKKDVIVKVIVNNAGLDFTDDVDFVLLTVPAEFDRTEIYKKIEQTDKLLRKEDEDGNCLYMQRGYNYTTLMDEVCEGGEFSYRKLTPEFEFSID